MSRARSDVTVMQALGLSDADIEKRWKLVGFGQDDLNRIAEMRDLLESRLDEYTSRFFSQFEGMAEAKGLTENPHLLQQARSLKRLHLQAMLSGQYGSEYVEQRLR